MAVFIGTRAYEAHVKMIGMPFCVAHNGTIALLPIGILDHRAKLGIGVTLLLGVIVEEFLQIVIDEDVLDFFRLEEVLDDEPVFIDVEIRSVHLREADELFEIAIDIADIDVAPRLVRKVRNELAAMFDR